MKAKSKLAFTEIILSIILSFVLLSFIYMLTVIIFPFPVQECSSKEIRFNNSSQVVINQTCINELIKINERTRINRAILRLTISAVSLLIINFFTLSNITQLSIFIFSIINTIFSVVQVKERNLSAILILMLYGIITYLSFRYVKNIKCKLQ